MKRQRKPREKLDVLIPADLKGEVVAYADNLSVSITVAVGLLLAAGLRAERARAAAGGAA